MFISLQLVILPLGKVIQDIFFPAFYIVRNQKAHMWSKSGKCLGKLCSVPLMKICQPLNVFRYEDDLLKQRNRNGIMEYLIVKVLDEIMIFYIALKAVNILPFKKIIQKDYPQKCMMQLSCVISVFCTDLSKTTIRKKLIDRVFVLNILFYIGVWPINDAVVDAGGQQRESATHIPVFILPQTPSHPGFHISLSRVL